MVWRLLLTLALGAAGASSAPADEDPFAAGVRPTEPRTPEEERKGLRVPPGFVVDLVASEPEIQKPINLAFDSRGRLWATCTVEYPYAAPADRPGKDSIRILEDVDGDGKADKITVFADNLNIPIGLLPYKNGCIAYSIPNIYWFEDVDGDGKADRREKLYGPFDYSRDTHGMQNAFRRGFDGWIYANHGFANHSKVRGGDGRWVEMHSGNTYRFRPDGSAIEPFTFGQVNPFGSTFDPFGELFTADCHTKPIMLLFRRGHYESFGKPHNGLGFVPGVMKHDHGSTAIAGTACYTGGNFPDEYQRNMFCGNVMTSRVNRDSLKWVGGTVEAIEEMDFVVSDDPWFRPVDLQIGPDGALYIADFYNKIIGHYEVPLEHPGRDRHRGRIWRVRYVGQKGNRQLDRRVNLAVADASELVGAFDHPNLNVRMRAADEIVDRVGAEAVDALKFTLRADADVNVRIQTMWSLFRLGALAEEEWLRLAADKGRRVRCHAMRLLAESGFRSPSAAGALVRGLEDVDLLAARMAADAAAQWAAGASSVDAARFLVPPLLTLWDRTPAGDVHLRHAVKLALREAVAIPGALDFFDDNPFSDKHQALLAEIALAVPGSESGAFVLRRLERSLPGGELLQRQLLHVARNAPEMEDVESLASIARRSVADELDLQLDLLQAIRDGLRQRGADDPPGIREWGAALAGRLLDSVDSASFAWSGWTPDGHPSATWRLETRKCADGQSAPFLSSLTLGEGHVGSLRSKKFVLPSSLSLFVCGHQGPPEQPAGSPAGANRVRIRLSENDEVIAEAVAPRNDVAQRFQWNLAEYEGRSAYIEAVDDLNFPGYAWIGVGRIEPPVVEIPRVGADLASRRVSAAARLAEAFALTQSANRLKEIVRAEGGEIEARAAAGRALAAMESASAERRAFREFGLALCELIGDPQVSTAVRDRAAASLTQWPGFTGGEDGAASADRLLGPLVRGAPHRLQTRIAERLAESRSGGETLLNCVAAGDISPRILQSPAILERLKSVGAEEFENRARELTASLPAVETETQRVIQNRRKQFDRQRASVEAGKKVFEKHCAACHQIAGKGSVVGPQLDGIGNRGLERILEDTLDPNRNVDPQFQATLFTLDDGRVVSGLLLRTEGQTVVYVDRDGKEVKLAANRIESQTRSKRSPMPDNWSAAIAEKDFEDLLAYLLTLRAEPAAPPAR